MYRHRRNFSQSGDLLCTMVQTWPVRMLLVGLLLAGWTASAAGSKQQEPSIETKWDATELQTVRCDFVGRNSESALYVQLATSTSGNYLAQAHLESPRGNTCDDVACHRLASKGYYDKNNRKSSYVEIVAAKTATDDLRAGSYQCRSSNEDGINDTWATAATWEQAYMFDCLVRSDDSDNNKQYSIKLKMKDGDGVARVVAPNNSNGSGIAGYGVFHLYEQSFSASPVLFCLSNRAGYARLVVVVSANVSKAQASMTCEVEESSDGHKSWTKEYIRSNDSCLGVPTPSVQRRSSEDGWPTDDACGKWCAALLACFVLSVVVTAIAIVYHIKKRSMTRPQAQPQSTEEPDEVAVDLLSGKAVTTRHPAEARFPISETV